MASKNWYLIYTKVRAEAVAESNLNRQGYRTYLPRIKGNKLLRGKYRDQIEAMFPRYLFIRLDSENDNWMPIRSTLGVSCLINFGGIPAKVPDALIEMLQQNEDEEGLHLIDENNFKVGSCVEFLEGAFRGYQAIIDKLTSQDRITVLLDVVGNYTRVTVSKHNLALA